MKHLLRIAGAAAIVLGVSAAAHAQGTTGGVRVGVNLADLSFDPSPPIDSEKLPGLVAGVFATVPISRGVAFQPEALFSMQGTKFSAEGMTAKTKFDYIQVPLLGRFQLGAGSPVAVLVGPSLGVRTRARFELPGAPPEFIDEFEDTVKRFDVGLVTGVAVDVGRAVLDARYTWGFVNLAKEGVSESGDSGSAKNRVLSLSAGVRF